MTARRPLRRRGFLRPLHLLGASLLLLASAAAGEAGRAGRSLETATGNKSVDPAAVASAVAKTLMDRAHTFINWEGGFTYGGAVTAIGVSEAAKLVNQTDPATAAALISSLDLWLDRYLAAPGMSPGAVDCDAKQPYGASNKTRSCAWSLLHRESALPSDEYGTVGDQLGSFPLAYLERYVARGGNDTDAIVATTVVLDFVHKYPYTISDETHTVSRKGGCCGPAPRDNAAPYLWADDQFMGLALTSRLAAAAAASSAAASTAAGAHPAAINATTSPLPGAATARMLMDAAAAMQLSYSKYLRFTKGPNADGLSAHGAWVGDGGALKRSCCKWGRANGWGALSRVEILIAIDAAFPNHSLRQLLLEDFVDFMDALVSAQDAADGRWHQLMDMPSTYLETSATAMSVTALAKGVTHGWFGTLRSDEYANAARAGWNGLLRAVNMTDGTVAGVCQGTGIMPNATAYARRPHEFGDSAPGGVGAVLLAAAAMAEMEATAS